MSRTRASQLRWVGGHAGRASGAGLPPSGRGQRGPRGQRGYLAIALAAAAACTSPERAPEGEFDLVEAQYWQLLSDEADPWFDQRPDDVEPCDPSGIIIEAQAIEITTSKCNWATVGQVLRNDVIEGDDIELLAYHGVLGLIGGGLDTGGTDTGGTDTGGTDTGAEDEQETHYGYMFLRVGERIVWELQVELPAASAIYNEDLVADWSAGYGTPVYLHVHNHGSNDWKFAVFERQARDGAD